MLICLCGCNFNHLVSSYEGTTCENGNCMAHDVQTSSLALILAPLSTRATTVAVWPLIDEK